MYAIWNLTSVCPWDCAICCVSSRRKKDKNLNQKELSLKDKLIILKVLAKNNIKIDFSGGDPLFYPEDFRVVSEATKILDKNMIDVSMTGCQFNDDKLSLLKKVGKVEISIDNIPGEINPFRPKEFNPSAISILEILTREGIFCSAVTTLYPNTIGEDRLKNLYEFLCSKKIPKWNILQYYPVGRGFYHPELILSKDKLFSIMDFLGSLKGSTEIVFQHSLRILKGDYQCHAAVKSIGILSDGTVSACGWALDKCSNCLPNFKLGKLPGDDLNVILKKALNDKGYSKRKDYCRILHCLNV